jgi:ATP-dependent 26S proteasome regulatory subunit
MPKRFQISLPNAAQRLKVLQLVLNMILLEDGFDYEELAKVTKGFSCSDLKELCRNAVMVPVRESIRSAGKDIKDINKLPVRAVKLSDFMEFVDSLFNDVIRQLDETSLD